MIERAARGETLEGDARPAVIQRLARRLVATRGKLTDEEFRSFQDQGITVPQMIAAVTEIAPCALRNYFNRLANTDPDPFRERFLDQRVEMLAPLRAIFCRVEAGAARDPCRGAPRK